MAVAEDKAGKQLREMTECSICMSTFIDPRMLPCIHTFCFKCLKHITEQNKLGDKIPCPLCRKEFTIPPEGIIGLQGNFFMENLLEYKLTLLQSNHAALEIGAETKEEEKRRIVAKFCTEHTQKSLDHYCVDCNQAVCVLCFVEIHQFHMPDNNFVGQIKEDNSHFEDYPGVNSYAHVLERRMGRARHGLDLACPSFNNAIVPTEQEKDKQCINLKYNCAADMYIRGEEKIDGWMSLVSEAKNMTRKVEYDWDKVYLARVDNVDHSKITWKVDLDSSRMSVSSVDIEVHSKCFKTGKIVWGLYGDRQMVTLKSGQRQTVTKLRDSKVLLLTATLTKGNGICAWQNTQLFRQKRFPMSGVDLEWPFRVVIHLKG